MVLAPLVTFRVCRDFAVLVWGRGGRWVVLAPLVTFVCRPNADEILPPTLSTLMRTGILLVLRRVPS